MLIEETVGIFIAATTGQGVEPDNMRRFWRFLMRKKLPTDSLSMLKYTVFGLGDSSYPKFNYSAKKLNNRIKQLGGTQFVPIGLADDQHKLGVDGAVEPWLASVWAGLLARYPLEPGTVVIPASKLPPPKYTITLVAPPAVPALAPVSEGRAAAAAGTAREAQQAQPDRKNPFTSTLLVNRRITTADHFQDVRHLVWDIGGGTDGGSGNAEIQYSPGDVCNIMPQNRRTVVKDILKMLNFNPEDCVLVTRQEMGPEVPKFFCNASTGEPEPRTLLDVCTLYLDIMAVPRRYVFELLSHFAAEPREKERLLEFATPTAEGQEGLYAYCNRMKRTPLEVFSDFPSTQGGAVPLTYLLDIFLPLQARAFSISSSQTLHPNEIHLAVAIVKYKTRMSVPRVGVCTSWFQELDAGAGAGGSSAEGGAGAGGSGGAGVVTTGGEPVTAQLWVTKGTFKVPEQSVPLVLVGPGTGCAPFRSILQQRVLDGATDNILFFGNRNRSGDYLYQDDWEAMVAKGRLKLFPAFSRDQDEKVYVQHLIKQNAAVVWEAVKNGGYFMIAGSSNRMPTDVLAALKAAVRSEGGLGDAEADAFIKDMEKSKRLQQETWG